MAEPVPGTCRHCGCTESSPCALPSGGGDTCGWIDKTRTVCSSPGCIKAETERKIRDRPRPLTSADIHQLIRRRKKTRKAA
jgi:hypothetical protein